MFCRKCGHKLNDDAKFCPKCGTPTRNVSHSEEEKQNESENTETGNQSLLSDDNSNSNEKKKKKRKKHPFIGIVLCISIIVGILLLTDYFKIVDYSPLFNGNSGKPGLPIIRLGNNEDEEREGDVNSVPEPINADEYFEENGILVSKVDAEESETMQSGNELVNDFTERGFSEIKMMVPYSSGGSYNGAIIDNNGDTEAYPVYQSSYVSATGILWTIFSINGSVMATPVTYNMQSDNDAKTMISEKETLVSYDGQTDSFYETVPNDTAVIVKRVEKITKELLDSLTVEDIDDL